MTALHMMPLQQKSKNKTLDTALGKQTNHVGTAQQFADLLQAGDKIPVSKYYFRKKSFPEMDSNQKLNAWNIIYFQSQTVNTRLVTREIFTKFWV